MDIGGIIKNYRTAAGMDQSTLGQLLGVSAKTISSWEVNRTQPKMQFIEDMCAVFNCKKSDFLGDEPESFILNHEEKAIITNYRKASQDIKNTICKILDITPKHKKRPIIKVSIPQTDSQEFKEYIDKIHHKRRAATARLHGAHIEAEFMNESPIISHTIKTKRNNKT